MLRRLLSHILPLTRTVHSPVSGPLYVRLHRGRKVLDTEHANYSYGALQQVLRYGLMFVDFGPVAHVLVLGLGGGSVVRTLRHELGYAGLLTAVELDDVVIQVAAEEFGVQANASLTVVCADAFEWVRTAPAGAFGLVVVDLFVDVKLPAGLQTAAFWHDVHRLLPPGGQVLFNTLVDVPLAVENQEIAVFLTETGFAVQDVAVEEHNRLLVLRKPAA